LVGLPDEFLHRFGELAEAQRVGHHLPGVRRRQRLVVGKEIVRLDEIVFRLLVVTTMNGVIGPLKEALLTVLYELQRQMLIRTLRQVFERGGGHHGGGGDVVLHLHLHGGMEILAQTKRAP